MNLRVVWESLEREARKISPPTTISKRIAADAKADLFAAVTPKKAKVLLLQLPQNPSTKPDFAAHGLQLSAVVLPGKDGDAHYWQLAPAHPAYFDLFISVTDDLITALRPLTDRKAVPKMFIQRLSVWQEFLAEFGAAGLSEKAAQGLIGELWHLQERMLPAIGGRDALASWLGPEKRPRDFQFQNAAIEVKTTTGKQHVTIQIANENQLDDAGLAILALCHIRLAQVQGEGLSLPELADSIRERFTPEGLAVEFDRKLRQCGYLDSQRDLYGNRYRIVAEEYYQVKDGFPRILSRDVPAGVGDIQYSLSVAGISKFKIKSDRVFAYFKAHD